jgi:ABC-2 type transport system ATP-binding protein
MPADSIRTDDLIHDFKGGRRAVDHINLRVQPGEVFGFLGPNGAGKSTTVLILTTLLAPTGGHAAVGGLDVRRYGKRIRSLIGAALQEVGLDPFLSGLDHLLLQMALHSMPRPVRTHRANTLLRHFGLEDVATRKVGSYSLGMKRKLDLALALAHCPLILFLDEPTTGLDPESRHALWEEISRLARDDGVTVFLTTQYMEEADLLADNIAIIDRGTIVVEGSPSQLKAEVGRPRLEAIPRHWHDRSQLTEVLSRYGNPIMGTAGSVAVRLRDDIEDHSRIVRTLEDCGIPVTTIHLREPTLDDVFLTQTGRRLEKTHNAQASPIVADDKSTLTIDGALAR